MFPAPLQHVSGTEVHVRGRTLVYFGGCDYFRLSRHSRIQTAILRGLKLHGPNVAASRITTGNHPVYAALETQLSRFFGCERALVTATGYQTNLMVAQAFAGEFERVLMDRRAHPSLQDAAQMLRAPVVPFDHRDPAAAHRAAVGVRRRDRILLLTDGMFAHDGSVAPLKAYREILGNAPWFLVDDAHGVGVLGDAGRGTVELEAVDRRRLVQTATVSKAFGLYGGMILADRPIQERIVERSQMFRGSTPPPPFMCHAALEALMLQQGANGLERRTRLSRNLTRVRSRLGDDPANPGPILAEVPRTSSDTVRFKKILLAHGIFPSFIQYPGGPESGYFRFALSSEHRIQQLDALAAALICCRETR